MSGICGLFNLDDKPVTEAELRAMTAMLERRGPDATRQWNDGPVGLGHTLLITTPELQFERQPFVHADTGCVVSADVRLDNRDALIAALVPGREPGTIGDAELILTAYLHWGEACLDRLLGDFAFAIWNTRQRILFCARDHCGMRPFYYHHRPGLHFVFASDARSILVLPQVPYRLNQGRIADFLVQELEWIDYTSTFFDDVYRLPPGHKATVTPAGLVIAEYWRPEPGQEPGPVTDDDYRAGFLEVFTQAVEARLRAPANTVGAMLSGGMDSGSVVAVAKDILASRGNGPLHTYSGTAKAESHHSELAEIDAITAATSMSSISPTKIYVDDLRAPIDSMIMGDEEPFDGQMMLHKAIYRAARSDGRRVVLDGAAGDVTLGGGSHIVRLLRKGQWHLAFTEIAALEKFWGCDPSLSSFVRYTRSAFAPEFAKKLARRLRRKSRVELCLANSLISREFAQSVHIDDRITRLQQLFSTQGSPDYFVERCDAIRPNMTGGRERYSRVAAAAAIEASDPFLDRRVIDYCARLPGRFRLKDGWPKVILRDLMEGRLPYEVRWCRGKRHVGWLFNDAVTKAAFSRGDLSLSILREYLGDYVDQAALTAAWQAFEADGEGEPINTAFVLSMWLRGAADRPNWLELHNAKSLAKRDGLTA